MSKKSAATLQRELDDARILLHREIRSRQAAELANARMRASLRNALNLIAQEPAFRDQAQHIIKRQSGVVPAAPARQAAGDCAAGAEDQ